MSSDLNYRHRNAQMASRASVELHTLIYFRKRYIPRALFLSLSLSLSLHLHKHTWKCNLSLLMQAHRHGGQSSEDKIQWLYCFCAQVCFLTACWILCLLAFTFYVHSCLIMLLLHVHAPPLPESKRERELKRKHEKCKGKRHFGVT